MTEKRERMTEAEQRAWEAEMAAAGILVATGAPSTVTLLTKTVPPKPGTAMDAIEESTTAA
jgi:hypothetical protein